MKNTSPSPPGMTFKEFYDSRDKLVIEQQGKLLTVKHTVPFQTPPPGGTRKEVTGFSYASRLRLIKLLAKINWQAVKKSLFCTLTYPDHFAVQTNRERNIHRQVMHRYLEKEIGDYLPCLWRVEWELRKSGDLQGVPCPHWHMLLMGPGFIPYARINELWMKTIGELDFAHTHIEQAKEEVAVGMYIAKYMAKDRIDCYLGYAAYHNSFGRHWGVLRKPFLPLHQKQIQWHVSDDEERFLIQTADDKLPNFKGYGRRSFTLIGKSAAEAAQKLSEIRFANEVKSG